MFFLVFVSLSSIQLRLRILTALVQPVQPLNVILAHLGGLAERHIGVGNGLHSGTVVLGEGIPGESQVPQCKDG